MLRSLLGCIRLSMSAQLILNPFKFPWTACDNGQVSSAESSTGLGAGPEMQSLTSGPAYLPRLQAWAWAGASCPQAMIWRAPAATKMPRPLLKPEPLIWMPRLVQPQLQRLGAVSPCLEAWSSGQQEEEEGMSPAEANICVVS